MKHMHTNQCTRSLPRQVSATPCELLEDDFDALAARLEGFSRTDCLQLVNEACRAPLEVVQRATHFREVHEDGWAGPRCVAQCGAASSASGGRQMVAEGWACHGRTGCVR